MPLLETRKLENDVALAIWKIEENHDYFLRLLNLTVKEQLEIAQMKGRRKTEWLASRWLWNTLAKDDLHGALIKDDFGKPHIQESSWHMSISHTHEYTAVITAPFLVGIDIQIKVDKISRLAEKFLAAEELEQVKLSASPIDHLHVYWGAKESLYKAYGRRALDFKSHLFIKSFNLEQGVTRGFLTREDRKEFEIRFEIRNNIVLVYALENI
ncbi:MAG: 4'-phosphopantetheinyl transferase superfamily protein [Saprospiraceae bacterium]|nr:4'-phosphopantetheinyl transferase superfamily protein [Saprospiraceae bacterium]